VANAQKMRKNLALPHERIDYLGDGIIDWNSNPAVEYHIIQDPVGFCFGIDAVCLADFATIRDNEVVLDIGCGSGIIPILLYAKTQQLKQINHFTGLEIVPQMADMARRSVQMNNLCEHITIDCGDIKENPYKPNQFDVITVNPPYINGGIHNQNEIKRIARHEITCTLDDILKASRALLKTTGRLYMIHRPNRLVDVFYSMRKSKLEPKTMQFIHSKLESSPNLVLIEAIYSGKPMLKILPPLVKNRTF